MKNPVEMPCTIQLWVDREIELLCGALSIIPDFVIFLIDKAPWQGQ
jgi:hypothetical protein